MEIFAVIEIPPVIEVTCSPDYLPVTTFQTTNFLIGGEDADIVVDTTTKK